MLFHMSLGPIEICYRTLIHTVQLVYSTVSNSDVSIGDTERWAGGHRRHVGVVFVIWYLEVNLTVSILLKPVNFASTYCK